ncbi:MAG: hypothetical protein RBG13Loki_0489 [Promethearchaeota archaeon CR_4]|nr:MAG: hypothetical protein RBG13Loki_0489 [Candidatus Lokiarchaeota archaeon CR_4]
MISPLIALRSSLNTTIDDLIVQLMEAHCIVRKSHSLNQFNKVNPTELYTKFIK